MSAKHYILKKSVPKDKRVHAITRLYLELNFYLSLTNFALHKVWRIYIKTVREEKGIIVMPRLGHFYIF